MVRNILKILVSLTIVSVLYSCDRLVESGTIIAGNQKYRSGEYQEAVINYLKGFDSESNRDYFYYNLGNVYSSLGEYPSAFSIWELTDGGVNTKLKFNLLYNRGFLEYQLGNYKEAYRLNREALAVMPSNIKAKINLELSLNKMNAASYGLSSESESAVNKEVFESDETKRILEYVRQKEAISWGSEQREQELENDW